MVRKDQKEIKFVKRHVPEHPYCSNWPMSENEDTDFKMYARVPEQYVGWLETHLPKSVVSKLWSYIETAKKNPINVNDTLAGNITKSLDLEDKDNWFLKNVLGPHIDFYNESYPLYVQSKQNLTEDAPYRLQRFWVNFQKENEFNPLHDHVGLFSFVVWMQIPTNWKEQHAIPISANSNSPKASDFEFRYTSMLGNISSTSYHLDKSSEQGMVFFPAELMHGVHPFYNCEEERISISGNIAFDISENSMRLFRSQMEEKDDQK